MINDGKKFNILYLHNESIMGGVLLEWVQLFISNDTGPFHIADALNIPFVVIFGPENFYRYGPYNTKSKSRICYRHENFLQHLSEI